MRKHNHWINKVEEATKVLRNKTNLITNTDSLKEVLFFAFSPLLLLLTCNRQAVKIVRSATPHLFGPHGHIKVHRATSASRRTALWPSVRADAPIQWCQYMIHDIWVELLSMCYAHSRRQGLRTPARNRIKHFLTSAARPATNLS